MNRFLKMLNLGGRNNIVFRVSLVEGGANGRSGLRWSGKENCNPAVFDHEPNTSAWQRFKAHAMRLLPIESQL